MFGSKQLDENVCSIHQLVPIQANYFMFILNGEPSFHIGIATTKSWNILKPSTSFGWNNFGTNQITLVNISLNDNDHFDGLNINSSPLLMGQGQVVSWLLPARPGSDTHGQQRPNALWMLSDSFFGMVLGSAVFIPWQVLFQGAWMLVEAIPNCHTSAWGVSAAPSRNLGVMLDTSFWRKSISRDHLCHHVSAPF